MKGLAKVGLIVALLCVSSRCLILADDLPKDSEETKNVEKRAVISSPSLADLLPDKLTEICQVCKSQNEGDKGEAVSCAAPYQRNRFSNTCIRLITTRMNWDDAKKFCESSGESLATFDTLESVVWMIGLRKTNSAWGGGDTWIGGRLTEGAWRWAGKSTAPIDAVLWCDGEPNRSSEECLSSRGACSYQLNNEGCGTKIMFICEKK